MSNNAAWIKQKKQQLSIDAAPDRAPGLDQIVIRNHALAINPFDWVIQLIPNATRWITYPFILGSDLAGEVVAVGSKVSRFKIGDRVLGHAIGTDKDVNSPAQGGFQNQTVVLERLASPIPSNISFEEAAVVPLGLSTAACGLFQKDHLGLQHPSLKPKPSGKTVIVWGGSTSVGSNAIQLAVAAGYEVITTASPKNFDYVKQLGASQVFDYNHPAVVTDIIAALDGKACAGALAIGKGSADYCVKIVHAAKGNKFVSMASPGVSLDNGLTPSAMLKFVTTGTSLVIKSKVRGVKTKFIYGSSLKNNEVSTAVYQDYLPAALSNGSFRPSPSPTVIGTGLKFLQAGLDMQRKGVSATKIVIKLM
jgi:NADPH:quinone reductase-like Zn-dependent oxidoreductase